MAEQIIQTLGFDASSAITTINTLNKSLAGLNTQLNNVAKAAKTFNAANLGKSLKAIQNAKPAQSLNNAATAAGNLGQKITQAGNQGGQALNNLNKQSKSLTISWQTLSRIIVAQTIVRGFNAITGAIKNSITETRELQKRIGEIETIANGALGSTAQIGTNLQVTAETFGFDILDVAEAKYQELSNQVDGSTESLDFQTAAAKLARATNTSLADATNLLSSTLNAFGKDASSAESAAGLLFTTIEQGRIRANELANSLGRVAPLANALGVDFNELGAGLARVTQGGTRADAAITQLLGIMNKLQAPTPALAEAFDALGVATAQQGIQQSGGFLPFLIRLKEEAGDVSELTSFFKNIRAIQGVLSLVGTDLDKTKDVFQEFGVTVAESGAKLNKAFSTASANDAVEYEKLIQKLGGTFRELATNAIPLINDALSTFIDTIETIRANPLFTGVLLVASAGALIGMGAAASIAAGGFAALGVAAGTSLIALGPAVVVFGAVAIAATAFAVALKNNDIKNFNPLLLKTIKLVKEMNSEIKRSKDVLDAQAEGFKIAARDAVEFGKQFGNLRKDAQDAVRELNSEFVDSSTSALQSLLKSRTDFSKELEKAVKGAESASIKSADKVASITAKKDDFLLKRKLDNQSDLQKSFTLFDKSRSQADDVANSLSSAESLNDFDAAAKVLETRLSLAEQGLAAANASGNAAAKFRAEQQVVTALNDQVNLEKRRNALIQERAEAAKAALAADKAQVQQLKTLINQAQKQTSIINQGGGILNNQQLAASEKKLGDILAQISDLALTSDQVDLGRFLDLTEFVGRAQSDMNSVVNTVASGRKRVATEARGIASDINSLIPDDIFQFSVDLGLTKGEGADRIADTIEAISNATKEVERLTGAELKNDKARITSIKKQQLLNDAFKDTTGPEAWKKAFDNTFDAVSTRADFGLEEFKKFQDFLKRSKESLQGRKINLGGDTGDAALIKETIQLLTDAKKAREEQARIKVETQSDRERLVLVQQFIDQASEATGVTDAWAVVLGLTENATGQVTAEGLKTLDSVKSNLNAQTSLNTTLDSTVVKANSVAEAQKRAATASIAAAKAAATANAAATGGAQGKMFGGTLYRAAGGTARGTDTIPAMLSPGEFVVNASSSRKFASQLNAINSGSNPVFRQEGGAVTNNTVNVGDINVNGTADPDDTARRVLSKIRREFRRGTASRF